ncbi:MAG: DNA-directed RNA polymerase subunit omega [Akkermansiaceae bacterium]|nr:DNA-directed RNA polymerase subunit omega [Akkermansiaceae bacterium]
MKTELIEKASRIVADNQLLINIVSKRVQQLSHGSDPYVPTTPEMGLGDIALTEIVEGKLVWREATEEELSTEEDPFAALAEEESPAAES